MFHCVFLILATKTAIWKILPSRIVGLIIIQHCCTIHFQIFVESHKQEEITLLFRLAFTDFQMSGFHFIYSSCTVHISQYAVCRAWGHFLLRSCSLCHSSELHWDNLLGHMLYRARAIKVGKAEERNVTKKKILNSKQLACYRPVHHIFLPLNVCIKHFLSWNLP